MVAITPRSKYWLRRERTIYGLMLRIALATTLDLSLVLRGLAATSVVWWHIHGYKAAGVKALNIPGTLEFGYSLGCLDM